MAGGGCVPPMHPVGRWRKVGCQLATSKSSANVISSANNNIIVLHGNIFSTIIDLLYVVCHHHFYQKQLLFNLSFTVSLIVVQWCCVTCSSYNCSKSFKDFCTASGIIIVSVMESGLCFNWTCLHSILGGVVVCAQHPYRCKLIMKESHALFMYVVTT